MIKKTLFLLITILALFMARSAYTQTPTPVTTTPATTAPTTAAPAVSGITLKDPNRGVAFTAPNTSWSVNAGKFSISLNHNKHYDAIVTLKSSWYKVVTPDEAYKKRKENLKSYLPGAEFLKENDNIVLGGSISALSMTYRNPSNLKILREILFIHKGQAYELVFQAKEENFQKVKADFGSILKNMSLY